MTQEKESPIKFPCEFIVKVMGKATDDFEALVLEIVQRHFPEITSKNITKNLSKESNYAALTITLYALSKTQLDALYQDLSRHPDVLMAL